MSGSRKDVRVAIAGSGFAGLGMAIRLREAGIEDFVVLERAHGLGGTWRDNTYSPQAFDETKISGFPTASFSSARRPAPATPPSPRGKTRPGSGRLTSRVS